MSHGHNFFRWLRCANPDTNDTKFQLWFPLTKTVKWKQEGYTVPAPIENAPLLSVLKSMSGKVWGYTILIVLYITHLIIMLIKLIDEFCFVFIIQSEV